MAETKYQRDKDVLLEKRHEAQTVLLAAVDERPNEIAAIPLIHQYYKGYFAFVNRDYFDELSKYKWRLQTLGNEIKAERIENDKRISLMQNVFDLALVPLPVGYVPLHKDDNQLNCTLENLDLVQVSVPTI